MNSEDPEGGGGGEGQEMSSFTAISSNGSSGGSNQVWILRSYPRASRVSPISDTPFQSFRKPNLLWITFIVLAILNSVLFVLYVLDAIGVGFRSPVTLVASSGGLFILFCLMSLYSIWRFKSERIMQDWIRIVFIITVFTVINLITFVTFLIWALKNPGFWKDIDFEDDPKAHDGYVAANAFAAALFVIAVLALWVALVIHYYFVKLLETVDIVITKAGSAGSLEDIMLAVTEGGNITRMNGHPRSSQTATGSYEKSSDAPRSYETEDTEAQKWR